MKKSIKILLSIIAIVSISGSLKAQRTMFLDLGTGINQESLSPVLALRNDWELGKKGKFIVGTGLRFNGFYGKDVYLSSAPNVLAIEQSSVDSLFAPKPNINSLNLLINLGYNINKKFQVGFDIDALGFSFGPTGSPTFISGGKSSPTSASPTSTNILLVGNNDKGSLNSNFHTSYKLNDKIALKLAYQYLFNELTTKTIVQKIPEDNDRFRVKSSQVFIGVKIIL